MPNIHGLSSLRNDNRNAPSSDSDDENNRYVGGVSSRGGGSGLAVLPNHETGNAASDSIFNLAESNDASSSNNTNDNNSQPVRRMITMYRSGFTVDNGPHRRLDDPSNAEFLGSLARGLIPRELREESDEGGEVMVGLVDRRGEEYDEERHGAAQQPSGSSGGGGGFQSFSGEGQALVDSSEATSSSSDAPGVINPSGMSPPAALDDSKPTTSIAVRLLNGKRLVIKINLDATVATLGSFIVAQSALEESFVMTSGYPPAVVEDLSVSVEEAGLKGAQVVLKRA